MKQQQWLVLVLVFLFSITIVSMKTDAATSDSLIKSASYPAVYYVYDGKRYSFPNEKTYATWYPNFSGVTTVSSGELASYPLAANVTYRPGMKLVKIQTDPKVYAVSRYGVLRWITTEMLAAELYGSNWNTKVDDVSDAFFTNYEIGEPILNANDYAPSEELTVSAISQNVEGGTEPDEESDLNEIATIAGCQVFPDDNAWNQVVSNLAVHPESSTYINSIGASKGLHPDFGENQDYGIPYNVVDGNQPKVPITWTAYGDESDPGPYPIPPNAAVEGGSDAHVLVLENDSCMLYELYAAEKNSGDNGWSADSGAIWHLNSNDLRPFGWTSADAAGLPILPGLVRYEEVAAGEIRHAIRFTASNTQKGYILPATHYAGKDNDAYPPMGLRIRMKASYDISQLTGQARVIAEAMKTYGMILADNGSNWYFQGATDPRWNDDELNQLKNVPGSAFEVVNTGPILK